jgi:serine/threonine-protein kinase
MKTLRIPAFILGLLYLCLFSYLAFSVSSLPNCVATHFNGGGQPNGWMSKSFYMLFMAIFSLVLPLFLIGVSFTLRFFPDKYFNIPHREYWLAPQRRAETFSYLFRHSLWFACIAVCFIIGIHFSIIQASSLTPAQLSTPMILGLLGCFLAGLVVWIVCMFRHFNHSN